MKALFVIENYLLIDYISSIISAARKNGISVVVFVCNPESKVVPANANQDFKIISSDINYGKTFNQYLSKNIRRLINYISFYEREEQSVEYVNRYFFQLPLLLRVAIRLKFPINRFININSLINFERKIPPCKKITKILCDISPGCVILAPHNKRPGLDMEFIKASKILNIPSFIATLSWDNLTTKGVITSPPDLFFVWNENQKLAALKYHMIKLSKIKISGAYIFDKWIDYQKKYSSSSPNCPEKHPRLDNVNYILYLGSSAGISSNESDIINELADKMLNSSDPYLKKMKIFLRPHPTNSDYIRSINYPNVIIYNYFDPKMYISDFGKETFFYELFWAKAVIGINTSGLLDSVINLKNTFAILIDKLANTQIDTLHFKELVKSESIISTSSFDELLGLVSKFSKGQNNQQNQSRFIEEFILPKHSFNSCGEMIIDSIINFKKN